MHEADSLEGSSVTYTRLHNLTLTICLGTCLLTSAWSASVFAQRVVLHRTYQALAELCVNL